MSEQKPNKPESVQSAATELPHLRNSQIRLDQRSSVETNKLFIQTLFRTELENASVVFQKLSDTGFERVSDPTSTLDLFLEHLSETTLLTLQISTPIPGRIRLGIVDENLLGDQVTRYAILECPDTEANFTAVQTLYNSVYG